jgi:hypothetical protein
VEATATLNAKKTQKNEQPASAAAPFQKKKYLFSLPVTNGAVFYV